MTNAEGYTLVFEKIENPDEAPTGRDEKFSVGFNSTAGLTAFFQTMTRDQALIMAGREIEKEQLEGIIIHLRRFTNRPFRPWETVHHEEIRVAWSEGQMKVNTDKEDRD